MNLKHLTEQEDIFQLAANLSEKIMKNHAFQDGNKRTALVAADMFLKINSYWLQNVPLAEDTNNKALADAHAAVIANNWNAQQLASFYKSVASEYKDGATEYLELQVASYGARMLGKLCYTGHQNTAWTGHSTKGVTDFREDQDIIFFRIADSKGNFGDDQLSVRVKLRKVPCDL
ncbi:Death on curing protein [Penicillium occitanis (nom. inval.)]|nr:Death on curing protein [Penicillium occitanis (nom. inval.)]PCG99668.1 hypothetical protein PENOC_056840 [Penicillium occitanis (nom. inval.)]